MKRVLIAAMLLVVATGALATTQPAFGDTEGTVEATVTVAGGVCLQVGATSIDFGTLDFSDYLADSAADSADFSVTNCSTDPHALGVRGTDATSTGGTAAWSLFGSFEQILGDGAPPFMCDDIVAGATNTFYMDVQSAGFFSYVTPFNEQLGVQPGGQSDLFHAHLLMPCLGSDGVGEAMKMDITFLALP